MTAAAVNLPHGLWVRLAKLQPSALFVWGRRDWLVPGAVAAHVRQTLPMARHIELDCGHVPQLERPQETQAAIAAFLPRDQMATPIGGPS